MSNANTDDRVTNALNAEGKEAVAEHVDLPRQKIVQLLRSAKALLAVAEYAKGAAIYRHDNLAPTPHEIKFWTQDIDEAEKVIMSGRYNDKQSAPPVTPKPEKPMAGQEEGEWKWEVHKEAGIDIYSILDSGGCTIAQLLNKHSVKILCSTHNAQLRKAATGQEREK